MTHVDDYIDSYEADPYASFVLLHFRLSAVLKNRFHRFMKDHLLFCTHGLLRYRVIGASRLGDVWLATDHSRDTGYDLRVDVAECSNWGPTP